MIIKIDGIWRVEGVPLWWRTKKEAKIWLDSIGGSVPSEERKEEEAAAMMQSYAVVERHIKNNTTTLLGWRTNEEYGAKEHGVTSNIIYPCGLAHGYIILSQYYRRDSSGNVAMGYQLQSVQYSIHKDMLRIRRANKLRIEQNLETERKYKNYPPYVVDRWVDLDGLLAIREDLKKFPPKKTDDTHTRAVKNYAKYADEEIDIDETIEALRNNDVHNGTAHTAFTQAVKQGDIEMAAELLRRMDVAADRHNNTDYDDLLASGIKKDNARKMYRGDGRLSM